MFCQMLDFLYAFYPHQDQFSILSTANSLQEKNNTTSPKIEHMF